VFLDGQHFAKFIVALAADVFVKRHKFIRLMVGGCVLFDEIVFLTIPVPSGQRAGRCDPNRASAARPGTTIILQSHAMTFHPTVVRFMHGQ
jgi:hypothetical protein